MHPAFAKNRRVHGIECNNFAHDVGETRSDYMRSSRRHLSNPTLTEMTASECLIYQNKKRKRNLRKKIMIVLSKKSAIEKIPPGLPSRRKIPWFLMK
jgi:hypothetical protein